MSASLAKQKPGRGMIPEPGRERPRPFSKLFYVAASRPAQMTTGQPASYAVRPFSSRRSSARGIQELLRQRFPRSLLLKSASVIGCAMPFSFAASDKGIVPDRMIAALAESGAILPAYPFAPDQVQPASLDLRLGDIAYRVRASFLPGRHATVAERIDGLKLHEF